MRAARAAGLAVALSCTLVSWAASTAPASAAERVYWANDGTNSISWANLDGSGGGVLDTGEATLSDPQGVAIDPAGGKIYWANEGTTDAISWANLDGSGGGDLDTGEATVEEPLGVSIDPLSHRIYWGNAVVISYASLAGGGGGGGGDLNMAGTTGGYTSGIAVEPDKGVVYWGNTRPGAGETDHISVTHLDDSGGYDLSTVPTVPDTPYGVAVDASKSQLYWANKEPNLLYMEFGVPLGGASDHVNDPVNFPHGLAVDPEAQRLYWINVNAKVISYGPTYEGPEGSGTIPAAGAEFNGANFPALLKAPSGTGAPAISGSATQGSTLSCSQGSWAADLGESFLFQAPQSFAYSWTRDGGDIAGASNTLVANAPGAYRCRVTATNAAGSASQVSEPLVLKAPLERIFSIGKPTLNKKKGTATLPVTVPGAGTFVLSGRGLVGRRATTGGPNIPDGPFSMLVRAKGRTQAKLNATGRARVTATVTFTPLGGTPQSLSEKLKLIKKHPHTARR